MLLGDSCSCTAWWTEGS